MSLLAYCYYMSQDFSNAARVYEQLVKYYPEVPEYKLYLAESHYKNGDLDEALKVSQTIQDPEYQQKLILLQALIKYSQDEIPHAKALLRQGTWFSKLREPGGRRHHRQLRLHPLQGGQVRGGPRQVHRGYERPRLQLRTGLQYRPVPFQNETAGAVPLAHR